MRLRQCREEDCKVLAKLFFNTVHVINAKDYSPGQLSAWATGQADLKQWNTSFLSHDTVVAEIGHKIVGFGDIDKRGIFGSAICSC